MIRGLRIEKKDLVFVNFRVKCGKCKRYLTWEQREGISRVIEADPCPDCTTVVNKKVGVEELRQMVLLDRAAQAERILNAVLPPPETEPLEPPRVERSVPRFTPAQTLMAKPLWLLDLEAKLAAFTFTVRELKRGSLLTPTAREELEEKLKENREVLITTVLKLSSTALEDSLLEERVEEPAEDGSCNCND